MCCGDWSESEEHSEHCPMYSDSVGVSDISQAKHRNDECWLENEIQNIIPAVAGSHQAAPVSDWQDGLSQLSSDWSTARRHGGSLSPHLIDLKI